MIHTIIPSHTHIFWNLPTSRCQGRWPAPTTHVNPLGEILPVCTWLVSKCFLRIWRMFKCLNYHLSDISCGPSWSWRQSQVFPIHCSHNLRIVADYNFNTKNVDKLLKLANQWLRFGVGSLWQFPPFSLATVATLLSPNYCPKGRKGKDQDCLRLVIRCHKPLSGLLTNELMNIDENSG